MKSRYFSSDYIIIFLVMFSTGLASLLYEVVLLSIVVTIVGATEVSAAIVLASFLLGLAVGSLIGGNISKRNLNFVRIMVCIELVIAIFGFSFLSVITSINSLGVSLNIVFWFTIFALLLPTILMGMEIPIAVKILEQKGKEGATGFVYFSDTLGGVIGAFFSGIFFIPVLGFHGAMYLGAFLNVMTSLFASRNGKKKNIVFILLMLVLLIAGVGFLFLSKSTFYSLKIRFLDSFYSAGSLFSETYYTKTVYSAISSFQHILVLYSPYYGYQLVLDGELQVSEKDSLKYHEYLVLPAVAAHPNPKNALVIGGGDGGSLYQLLKFNFTTIDHVDLDKKVVEVSKESEYGFTRQQKSQQDNYGREKVSQVCSE